MSRWLMRHAASDTLNATADRAGYAAPAWTLVRELAPSEDASVLVWRGGAAIEDLAMLDTQLVTAIKAEAERRKMLVCSPGGAKKLEYANKRGEVLAWETLGGTAAAILLAFNALPTAVRTRRFRWAIADAAARGDQPADAVARFKVGLDAFDAECARLAGIEAARVAAVKAASSAAGKRAAAGGINWG